MPESVAKRFMKPVERFMALEVAGGIVLLVVTVFAMLWANSSFAELYDQLLHIPIGFSWGPFELQNTLHHWVNDGLMVLFFFVVGLEIKGELIHGELASPKKAALPLFAALGGMLAPALIYTMFNYNQEGGVLAGWGIPMATDIAFAIGILALLGPRVPLALKVFLLALAIVDDLGAVLVIAFFYTSDISGQALGLAATAFITMFIFNIIGVRAMWTYVVLGFLAWLFVLQSGIHATIAGVILGLITPAKAYISSKEFGASFLKISEKLKTRGQKVSGKEKGVDPEELYELQGLAFEGVSPLERTIHYLHPWVTFFIMPVFALFNAGVPLAGLSLGEAMSSPISLGVLFGLLFGKPIGIVLLSFISVKLGFAVLPKGTNWLQITGLGFMAGIGFTMALFISNLAIADPDAQSFAKLSILGASVVATCVGLIILYFSCSKTSSAKTY